MAGLLAARALSDHFEKVTILERDELPSTDEPRKGVPQGRHVHNLLSKGDEILTDFFPGLLDDLAAAGAVRADWSRDVRWHHHGVWKARVDSGVESFLMSRPLLERLVREHVERMPSIELRRNVAAEALELVDGRVCGARIEDRNDGTQSVLEADLVVDCTGRGSKMPRWLADAGCSEIETLKINSDVVYATRIMRGPSKPPGFKVLAQIAPPPGKRSAVMFSIERGLWQVTLFGYHGEHPPADEDGWLAFAKSLVVPDASEAIASFEPVGRIERIHFPASQWRRLDRVHGFPAGLIVMGDAICSFNPIYGQGMTVAALEAQALRSALANNDDLDAASAEVRTTFARIVDDAWKAVASEDFRHRETTGARMRGAAFINWYTRRVHQLAAHDPRIVRDFLAVMHMQASVTSLFTPRTLAKVLTRLRRPAA